MIRRGTPHHTKSGYVMLVFLSFFLGLLMLPFILSATGVISVTPAQIWLPAVFSFAGCVIFCFAVLKKRSLLWYSLLLMVVAVPLWLPIIDGWSHLRIYPMIIASPAVASLLTLPFAVNKRTQVFIILTFSAFTGIFLFQVFGLVQNWYMLAGLAAAAEALIVLAFVLTHRRSRWDKGNSLGEINVAKISKQNNKKG